mmetsp:Transcript_33306/g.78990  ORF Transcript_33306/g.78990 Transcript_33306/m.78990 type:complete len:225 (+) Transcript_33306:223-897(+)
MVEDTCARRRYPEAPEPLSLAGRAARSAAASTPALSARLSRGKSTLPIGTWMTPPLSARNSTRPRFMSAIAFGSPEGSTMVPSLGLGIRPRGPRMRATFPRDFIVAGVAMHLSKPILLPPPVSWTCFTRSSPPAMSAPAARAPSTSSGCANTATLTSRPVPCGRLTLLRTIWSPRRGSMPRLTASSTVSTNFLWFFFASSWTPKNTLVLDLTKYEEGRKGQGER